MRIALEHEEGYIFGVLLINEEGTQATDILGNRWELCERAPSADAVDMVDERWVRVHPDSTCEYARRRCAAE